MSGSQASTGIDMLRGAQLAAGQLDSGTGVLGRKVKVVRADDGADPSQGVVVAKAMIARSVTAVVGPFNSSVGVKVLPLYRGAGIAIVRLTSSNLTQGFGVTAQPMASQIAPVESQELQGVLHVHSVAILYDPSTYTAGIAEQLRGLLTQGDVTVPVDEALAPGADPQGAIAQIVGARPDLVYLAMYDPEAGSVAAALSAAKAGGRCFVDLAAQGPDFVSGAGVAVASKCLSSGVPAPAQLPGGAAYVSAYEAAFHQAPGTWGIFAYDSMLLLARAARTAGTWSGPALARALDHITGLKGATGTITIDPGTGNRVDAPVVILDVDASGAYVVDPTWAAYSKFPIAVSSGAAQS